jgi:hypothetical protein
METVLLATIVITFKLMVCVALYGIYRTVEKSAEYSALINATDKLVGEISYSINVSQRKFWSQINTLTDKTNRNIRYFQF